MGAEAQRLLLSRYLIRAGTITSTVPDTPAWKHTIKTRVRRPIRDMLDPYTALTMLRTRLTAAIATVAHHPIYGMGLAWIRSILLSTHTPIDHPGSMNAQERAAYQAIRRIRPVPTSPQPGQLTKTHIAPDPGPRGYSIARMHLSAVVWAMDQRLNGQNTALHPMLPPARTITDLVPLRVALLNRSVRLVVRPVKVHRQRRFRPAACKVPATGRDRGPSRIWRPSKAGSKLPTLWAVWIILELSQRLLALLYLRWLRKLRRSGVSRTV